MCGWDVSVGREGGYMSQFTHSDPRGRICNLGGGELPDAGSLAVPGMRGLLRAVLPPEDTSACLGTSVVFRTRGAPGINWVGVQVCCPILLNAQEDPSKNDCPPCLQCQEEEPCFRGKQIRGSGFVPF